MHQLFSFLALVSLVLGAQGRSCGITGTENTTISIPGVLTESTPADSLFAQFQTFGVSATATVSHPYNKYITALRYSNGVYELKTNGEFTSFVVNERDTFIERTVRLTCIDGSFELVTFNIDVRDENNNAPVFDKDSYSVEIKKPLIPSGVPSLVRTGIIVLDSDVDFANADLHFTTSHRDISPAPSKLWDDNDGVPTAYSYAVDFLVPDDIPDGIYTVFVTADDGRHPSIAIVNIIVTTDEPEPEPSLPTSQPTTTTPTTTTPTTTTPTTTTPTTTTPTTTTPTTTTPTTTPEPETTEPEPEYCGIEGIEPGVIYVDEQEQDLPTGTVLWRGDLVNVVSSSAVGHPHNQYTRGLRQVNAYWIETTDSYPRFISEQGTTTLQRTVNLFCTDGTSVQYQFRVAVNDGPILEPTLKSVIHLVKH